MSSGFVQFQYIHCLPTLVSVRFVTDAGGVVSLSMGSAFAVNALTVRNNIAAKAMFLQDSRLTKNTLLLVPEDLETTSDDLIVAPPYEQHHIVIIIF